MGLDVRVPVGLMFATMGVLLVAYGVFGDQSIYGRSLGINVNLIWGLVILAFAVTMLAVSKVVISLIPDFPLYMPSHDAARSLPSEVISPIPVMTTRDIESPPKPLHAGASTLVH